MDRSIKRSSRRSDGFTIIELLVVIGILALLVGMLFPSLRAARRSAANLTCTNHMRQLGLALLAYAGQNRGAFPPNSGELGQFWYLESIIGAHVTAPDRVTRSGAVPAGADKGVGLAGGVFRCSNDLDDSVRSYSMNVFASSAVSSFVLAKLNSDHPPGRLFKPGPFKESSRMILLAESWPELPVRGTTPTRFVAQAVVGLMGAPGEKFGAGNGVVWKDPPDATPGRFGIRASQIAFYRHAQSFKKMEQPKGRANFAFVDGHVDLLQQEDLATPSGKSTYLALWSPVDREVEGR